MSLINYIQFILGVGLLLVGLSIFAIELIGVFKFKYILNRMHAAAMGDTIGIGMSLLGLIILCGFNYTSLKMALIIVFLWQASPVSSHLISRLEVTTNEEIDKFCDRKDIEIIKESSIIEDDEKISKKSAIMANTEKTVKKSRIMANDGKTEGNSQAIANNDKTVEVSLVMANSKEREEK